MRSTGGSVLVWTWAVVTGHVDGVTRDEAELVERVARALATAPDAGDDGCFDRVDEWEAREQWERDAYADDTPHSDYEDCEYWRRLARAAVAACECGDSWDRRPR